MISKSIVVIWSIVCFSIFAKVVGDDPSATAFSIVILGIMWAIVVTPTAAIGGLFKNKEKVQEQRNGLCGFKQDDRSTAKGSTELTASMLNEVER